MGSFRNTKFSDESSLSSVLCMGLVTHVCGAEAQSVQPASKMIGRDGQNIATDHLMGEAPAEFSNIVLTFLGINEKVMPRFRSAAAG